MQAVAAAGDLLSAVLALRGRGIEQAGIPDQRDSCNAAVA